MADTETGVRLARAGWASFVFAMAWVIFAAPAMGVAASAPNRAEYVTRLEQICKPRSEATSRAVSGVKRDVRTEHLRQAAPKVAKAQRIFAATVGLIAGVPRPPDDRYILNRWFTALHRESSALERTTEALRADDVPRFERVWADFVHQGSKANNVVISFGFDYCAFKASRFE